MLNKLFNLAKIYFFSFFIFILLFLITNFLFSQIIDSLFVSILFLFSFLLWWLTSKPKKNINLLLLFWSLILIWWLWSLIFYYIRDISVDWNTYHLEAIFSIFNWVSFFKDNFSSIRLNYYPKTIEILFSGFSSFFSNYDMGRIFKLFLIILSLINVNFFFHNIKKKNKINLGNSIKSNNIYLYLLLSFIIVFNPVVLYQFFSLYIDDVLYLLLINFFIYFFLKETKIALIVFSILISSKISYALFGWLGLLFSIFGYSFFYKQSLKESISYHYKKLWGITLIRIVFIFILFFVWTHQYIINSYKYNNPFYWFIWEGKKDIITMFQPPKMKKTNKLNKFRQTFFSYSRNYCVTDQCLSYFSFDKKWLQEYITSYRALTNVDPNINGFWNLYSILLLFFFINISFSLFSLIKKKVLKNKDKNKHKYNYFSLCGLFIIYILICMILLPFPWARYSPLFYLLPLISLIYISKKHQKTVLFLYIINLLLIGWFISIKYGKYWLLKYQQIQTIKEISFQKIYYTSYYEWSYFPKKFLSFYKNTILANPTKKINKEMFFDICWIKDNSKIITSYNAIYKCPNWWIALKWNYWLQTEDYFYFK